MAAEHNQYGPGHAASQVKHHEWRTAENSAQYLIPHLQSMTQEKPRLKLLDVGAGSGTITTSLAKYMPDGQLLGTDISDEILERARQHAESKGVKNVTFQEANVFALPFADSTFDVTHAHQVLCHLDAPADAIREMLRVTRPGGIVALRESDAPMWCFWPDLPALRQFHDLMTKTLVANGGQEKAGRQLVSWAMKAGVAREDIDASFGTWCYSAPGDRLAWSDAMIQRLRHGQMRGKSVELGIATEQEMDAMADAWEEWAKTDDATLGLVNGQVVARRK